MKLPFAARSAAAEQAKPLKAIVIALSLIIATAVVSFEFWTAYVARDGQLSETRTKVGNLSSLVSEHAERSIEAADIVLRGLVDRVGDAGLGSIDVSQQQFLLPRRAAELAQVAELAVIDSEGREVVSSLPGSLGQGVADRAYFIFHREHPYAGLHISGPIPGRARGRSVFIASRGLKYPDGRFAGVVMAALHTQFYQDFYEGLQTGRQGQIMLATDDGTVQVRQPYSAENVGRNLGQSDTIFADYLPKSPTGSLTAVSPLDGVERWSAYRHLLNSNLVVVTALSEGEELSGWRSQVRDQMIAVFSILLVLFAGSGYLLRQISQRTKAELNSAASAAQYKLLADNSTDVILRIGFDRIRRYVSPSAAAVLGYSPDELIGCEAANLTDQDDRKLVHAAWERVKRGDGTQIVTSRIRHKAGHLIWVETTISPIHDPDTGKPVEMVASMREITTRKAIEARLTDAVRELSTARDAAESATRAKSQFLAAMSHEIRTPLNAVIGFAELMQKTAPSETFQGYAELQLEAGNSLLNIINDILDFSKLEAGKLDLHPMPVDLGALVHSCADTFRRSAKERGLELSVFLAADLPMSVVMDGKRLQQILGNLLSNAIKFTRSGRISIAARRTERNAVDSISIAVSDTGIGIPEEKIGLLFQRFSQLDAAIDREFGGTGLGLAISQFLAKLMDGEITVETRLGVGSTFTVEMPLRPAEATVGDTHRSSPNFEYQNLGLKVLVAEDDRANQRLIGAILEDAGCAVDIVATGEAAVSAVQERDYDLVLMDVGMPGMDGMQATRRIRRLIGDAALTPIVALTAHVFPGDAEQCIAAGMQAHVGKPIDRRELLAVMASVVHGKTKMEHMH